MILVDSCVWFACWYERDVKHEIAVEMLESINGQQVATTEHVLDETCTLLRAKGGEGGNKKASEFFDSVFGSTAIVSFVKTEETALLVAKEIFGIYKKLSFTDSTLIALAKQHGFEVATIDNKLKSACIKEKISVV